MANPTVLLETTSGDILIELYADKAPATVENFLKYVNEGFYANTIFHRVIKGFMIQGGGMNMKMEEKATHAPIKNEADNGLANERGTIAATACSARSSKAWKPSTRSKRKRPPPAASIPMCRFPPCSSPTPACLNKLYG